MDLDLHQLQSFSFPRQMISTKSSSDRPSKSTVPFSFDHLRWSHGLATDAALLPAIQSGILSFPVGSHHRRCDNLIFAAEPTIIPNFYRSFHRQENVVLTQTLNWIYYLSHTWHCSLKRRQKLDGPLPPYPIILHFPIVHFLLGIMKVDTPLEIHAQSPPDTTAASNRLCDWETWNDW